MSQLFNYHHASADILRYKRQAAKAAVAEVCDGMMVGLGSGTTAAEAVTILGQRVLDGLVITIFASSEATAKLAIESGMRPKPFDATATLDLTIDGVDEIDPDMRAIKGGGGALLREKILANAAARMIAIADTRKCVAELGSEALPVEVLPFARGFVAEKIAGLGGNPVWRRQAGEPVVTDQRNHILDCTFAGLGNLTGIAAQLNAIPGVMAHGLFLTEIDALYVAGPDGVEHIERNPNAMVTVDLH